MYSSNQFGIDRNTFNVDKSQSLNIVGASIGLGQRLKWPDDYFQLSQTISYQALVVNNYSFGLGGIRIDNAIL